MRLIPSMSARRLGLAALVACLFAALAGCGTSGGWADAEPSVSAPFAACPQPGSFAPEPSVSGSGTSPTGAGSTGMGSAGGKVMPDLSLPCFVGSTDVALRALGRPAVINLWASWCDPCRAELPEFQHLADRAGGRFAVLGVVTDDRRSAAASLAADAGITFPTLFDPSAVLRQSVAPSVLPVTLFVDDKGVVRHIDLSGALRLSTLEELVRAHLGVVP